MPPSRGPVEQGTANGEAGAQRVYGGLTTDERRGRRRQTLIDTVYDLVGSKGYQAATVRAICKAAGLSERYFYESFSSREEIFSALYTSVLLDVRQDVLEFMTGIEAGQSSDRFIKDCVGAVVRFVAADPRRVNIIFIDVRGITTDRDMLKVTSRSSFSTLIEQVFVEIYGADHRLIGGMAIGLVGFMARLMDDWHHRGADPAEIDDLVRICGTAYTATAHAFAELAEASDDVVEDPSQLAEVLESEHRADAVETDHVSKDA